MPGFLSVIVPSYNAEHTIGPCLASLFASVGVDFEVIVVDDCSRDGSAALAEGFPCTLIRLAENVGAASARNVGAAYSRGDLLFFTDADCRVSPDTLALAKDALQRAPSDAVIGGTYTESPADSRFFSWFQSIFVNYSETKHLGAPDYVATHAMALRKDTFCRYGGFRDEFLPILEDVEFSHRLRQRGCQLRIDPHILVRHTFNFSLWRSLRNAFRKSLYWTAYSLRNKDLFVDSGTASTELKFNVFSWAIVLALLSLPLTGAPLLLAAGAVMAADVSVSRHLLQRFFAARGPLFGCSASLYYLFVYPAAISIGIAGGILVSWRRRTWLEAVR